MPHPYADIPEVAELQAGGPLIRIPDRLNVPFTDRVRAIVDTAAFQRLGRISQLGLTSKVYPGATHTRFEHSLGVFYNACRYLAQLGMDTRFAATVDRHQAEVLLAASLLHDLGHYPFCHPIEDMHLPDWPAHEQLAAAYLGADSELAAVLNAEWRVTAEEVLDVLDPLTDLPALRLMRSVLSGPIDIDKLDYLERDSLHAGVSYGRNFDRERLTQSLVVNAACDGLAITDKGKTAAELMVFARYVMFSEVYWHHAVRAATCMLCRGIFELREHLDVTEFCRLSESEFVTRLMDISRGTVVEHLLDGLFGERRRLYKRLVEFSASQQPDLYRRLAGRPYAELQEIAGRVASEIARDSASEAQSVSILIDAPPVDKEIEFRVNVCSHKDHDFRPLQELSPVVAALAHVQFDDYVKRVRVFAEPAVASQRTPSSWRDFLRDVLGRVV